MFGSALLRSLGFLLVFLCWFAGGTGNAGAVVPSGNLVQNPGAETGTGAADESTKNPPPLWGASGSFTAVKYGAPLFPTAGLSASIGGGTNFFAGGPGAA